jgi:hypothetical protein
LVHAQALHICCLYYPLLRLPLLTECDPSGTKFPAPCLSVALQALRHPVREPSGILQRDVHLLPLHDPAGFPSLGKNDLRIAGRNGSCHGCYSRSKHVDQCVPLGQGPLLRTLLTNTLSDFKESAVENQIYDEEEEEGTAIARSRNKDSLV